MSRINCACCQVEIDAGYNIHCSFCHNIDPDTRHIIRRVVKRYEERIESIEVRLAMAGFPKGVIQ